MLKVEGRRYKFLRPREDWYRSQQEMWKIDFHTVDKLRTLGATLKPADAADLMVHYIVILRNHLCTICPYVVWEHAAWPATQHPW